MRVWDPTASIDLIVGLAPELRAKRPGQSIRASPSKSMPPRKFPPPRLSMPQYMARSWTFLFPCGFCHGPLVATPEVRAALRRGSVFCSLPCVMAYESDLEHRLNLAMRRSGGGNEREADV